MGRNRSYLNCASALVLIGAAFTATAARAADPAPPSSQKAASDQNSSTELVVTAERRVERLQSTAISATVLDPKILEEKHVVSLTDLQYVAPGLEISDFSSANTFNIRGIGQSAVNIDLPSGVVIYRDGVPTLTGYFQNAPYYDMAGVEVLRGPQGTFVGKSAAAGALFIRTQDPALSQTGGDVMAGIGNRGFYETTDVLNVPIDDTLAVRFAFHTESRESLFNSLTTNPLPGGAFAGGPFTGNDHRLLFDGRLGVLWQPDAHLRVLLKVDYDYLNFGSHAVTGFNPVTGTELNMENPVVNGQNKYIDKGARASLNVDYDFANGFTLKSLTGFSTVTTLADWDANGQAPAPDGFNSGGTFTNYSQEVDLISPTSNRLRFVTGLFTQYYLNDIPRYPTTGLDFYIDNTNVPIITSPWQKNELTYAGFAQLAYDITQQLELQVGARLDHYQFSEYTDWVLKPGVLNIPFGDPVGGLHQNFSENSVDWKVNLNYKINDDQFLYAVVSRGHTPGSINAAPNFVTVDAHTAYKAMDVINYEGGWKASFFNKHLNTQLAVYYQTFDNYQAAFAEPALAGIAAISTVSEFKNALTASKIYGVELGSQGQFGDVSVDFAGAWSQSVLGSFGRIQNIFQPVYGGPAAVSLAGTSTPFAPEWTANGGIGYTFHLNVAGEAATLTPRFDVSWRSNSYSDLFHNRATLLEGGALFNANLRFERGPLWVELWGTNLANRIYPSAKQNVTGAGGTIQGIVYMAPPRLFGLRIGRKF